MHSKRVELLELCGDGFHGLLLIGLERQHVVAAGFVNLPGDPDLASHGVDAVNHVTLHAPVWKLGESSAQVLDGGGLTGIVGEKGLGRWIHTTSTNDYN